LGTAINAQTEHSWKSLTALVLLCGTLVALHVGKMPPALIALRAEFGLSLIATGWLISVLQVAGATLALLAGLFGERFGCRPVLLAGLGFLAAGSSLGALASSYQILMLSRLLESIGYLMAAVTLPALLNQGLNAIRQVPITAQSRRIALGVWGTWMPNGVALGMILAPFLIQSFSWRGLWWFSFAMTLVTIVVVMTLIKPVVSAAPTVSKSVWPVMSRTLSHRAPWIFCAIFMCYSAQWMGVFGFLPTIYAQAGLGANMAAMLTAIGVIANAVGNVASGILAGRGFERRSLIKIGACAMLIGAMLVFSDWQIPFALRYAGLIVFSGLGGFVPAALFSYAGGHGAANNNTATTVGLMQQGSSFGQLFAPVALAALASLQGDWSTSWWLTGAFSCLMIVGARFLKD
jgi:MFS transporter, CP family, cyanate transporter